MFPLGKSSKIQQKSKFFTRMTQFKNGVKIHFVNQLGGIKLFFRRCGTL